MPVTRARIHANRAVLANPAGCHRFRRPLEPRTSPEKLLLKVPKTLLGGLSFFLGGT
jgi:hypothetical protein